MYCSFWFDESVSCQRISSVREHNFLPLVVGSNITIFDVLPISQAFDDRED